MLIHNPFRYFLRRLLRCLIYAMKLCYKGLRPHIVLWRYVWICSLFYVSKQGWLLIFNHYDNQLYFCKSTSLTCDNLETGILNTLRPRQNGRHLPDDIFKCIFRNENVSIFMKISLNVVPKGPISNIPALVQIMAWRRPGDKPLSEPMMVS